MLSILNVLVSIMGSLLCVYTLASSKCNTKYAPVQWSFVLFGLTWLMLFLADMSSKFEPTYHTVIARYFGFIAHILFIVHLKQTTKFIRYKLNKQEIHHVKTINE